MTALSMSNCSICRETIDSNTMLAEEKPKTLYCRHTFHTECIAVLTARLSLCPCCPQTKAGSSSDNAGSIFDLEMPKIDLDVALTEVRKSILKQRQVRKLADEKRGQMTQTAEKCGGVTKGVCG